eukprot:SAG25_NODE_13012_length_272_cov_1.057803_1_plen_34_part_10
MQVRSGVRVLDCQWAVQPRTTPRADAGWLCSDWD